MAILINVDNGKYTFSTRDLTIVIDRHGSEWHEQKEAFNALRSMMCELDAARVVIEAARALGAKAPPEILQALANHAALVDDNEKPSEWTR